MKLDGQWRVRLRVRTLVGQVTALVAAFLYANLNLSTNYAQEILNYSLILKEPGFWATKIEPSVVGFAFILFLGALPPALLAAWNRGAFGDARPRTSVIADEYARWTLGALVSLAVLAALQLTVSSSEALALTRELWANALAISGTIAGLAVLSRGVLVPQRGKRLATRHWRHAHARHLNITVGVDAGSPK